MARFPHNDSLSDDSVNVPTPRGGGIRAGNDFEVVKIHPTQAEVDFNRRDSGLWAPTGPEEGPGDLV
jgi:hypothetical protein